MRSFSTRLRTVRRNGRERRRKRAARVRHKYRKKSGGLPNRPSHQCPDQNYPAGQKTNLPTLPPHHSAQHPSLRLDSRRLSTYVACSVAATCRSPSPYSSTGGQSMTYNGECCCMMIRWSTPSENLLKAVVQLPYQRA